MIKMICLREKKEKEVFWEKECKKKKKKKNYNYLKKENF
jgi:hypothetical protein